MDQQGHGSGPVQGAGDRAGAGGPGGPDPVALLEQAAAAVQQIVDRVKPDQMELETPCTDWTVRDVIDHIAKGNAWAAANLGSETGTAPRPTESMVGGDPARALRDTSGSMLDAFTAPGARQKMLSLPFGDMPGAAFAGVRATDLLVHGWDIAKATGQPTDFAPELNEIALAGARRTLTFDRAGSPFGAEQPVAADAPAADRLAGFLGRIVS